MPNVIDDRSSSQFCKDHLTNLDFFVVGELCFCIIFAFTGPIIAIQIFESIGNHREVPYQITARGDVILDQYLNRSYMVEKDETIPTWLFFVLSGLLPLLIVVAVGTYSRTKHDLHSAVCSLTFALGTNGFITFFLKVYVGYLRPNFYGDCQFDVDALDCKNDDTDDARVSFVSGHASTSFCTMTVLTLFFLGKIAIHREGGAENIRIRIDSNGNGGEMEEEEEEEENIHGRKALDDKTVAVYYIKKRLYSMLASTPMFLAIFIAASRVHDDVHHPADVVGGALVGIGSAVFSYGLWYNSIYSTRAGYPLHTSSR